MDSCAPHLSVHEAGCLRAHRHRNAYAALVLSGGFRESGPDGIWDCQAGDLILHPTYHLHADAFSRAGARVLNIELSGDASPSGYHVLTVADPGRLLRRVRHDRDELFESMKQATAKNPTIVDDWRGAMAKELARRPTASISRLAADYGMSLAHVSRAFKRAFGIGPVTFRAEHRLRTAIRLLSGDGLSLADIAYASGYSDQAHLTRSFAAATGLTPARARRG